MSDFILEQIDDVPSDLEAMSHQGHVYDEAQNGVVCNYKKFSIVIKNNEDKIVGFLIAYTAYAEIYIDDIWVQPAYRGQGLGCKLLNKLEQCYKGKGYNNMNLVTSSFQAPEFYKKCGFEQEFTRINQHHPKLTKIFFIKYFDDEVQNQGVLEKD